jgi:RimJ/RimL family protein N-acetyltransferase
VVSFEQRPEYLQWAEGVLGQKFDPKTVSLLTSLSQSGTILGVVIFSRFTTGNCEITVAARDPRFISKRFALAVAAYPFLQLGYRRVTAFIAVDNLQSLDLAQRLGFRIEGTARYWFPSGDAYILGLLREDCKFLPKDENGQPFCTPGT